MEGAADRARQKLSMTWWGAMMPHMKKPPEFHEFVGVQRKPRPHDWQGELAKWQAYAAAKGH
jgi:hypothetical protein